MIALHPSVCNRQVNICTLYKFKYLLRVVYHFIPALFHPPNLTHFHPPNWRFSTPQRAHFHPPNLTYFIPPLEFCSLWKKYNIKSESEYLGWLIDVWKQCLGRVKMNWMLFSDKSLWLFSSILPSCVFSQTFYPDLQIFIHRYIRHICDISQLCTFGTLRWRQLHYNLFWRILASKK